MSDSITLENDLVKLSPLTLNNFHYLYPIASQKKLVQFSPSDIETPEALKNYVESALRQRQRKTTIPFIIFDKNTRTYAGSTCYMNIDRKNKVLEIGATWIGRQFHGSGLNDQMKILMLDHAFGPMGFEKVEFRVDERNMRSRKAVEKLGGKLEGKLEGILRCNVYMLDGFKRNTCCFGLLKEEWNAMGTNNLITE